MDLSLLRRSGPSTMLLTLSRTLPGVVLACLGLLVTVGLMSLTATADDPPTATIDEVTPSPAFDTQTVSFSGHGSDDGSIVAYRWSSDVDGLLSGRASFTFTGLSVATHTISLEVQDDQGQWSDPDITGLQVQDNLPPEAENLVPGANQVYRGASVTLTSDASDDRNAEDELTPLFVYQPPDLDAPTWTEAVDGAVFSLDLSAEGDYIVVGAIDTKVALYHRDSPTPLWEFDTGDIIYSVAISRDGQFLAAGEKGGKVYLFERGSATPLWNHTTGGDVRALAFSERGEYLAVGSMDGKVYLFDRDSSTPEWDFTTGGPVMAVAISQDGAYVVAGSNDNEVYLFETASGNKEWQSPTGDTVNSVAISRTGAYIVAGSNDNSVYLYGKGSPTAQWSDTTSGDITSVSMSADGWYLAAGSTDNSLYFYKRDSAEPLWSRSTGGTVRGVQVSSDGYHISAGSEDGSVYLFSRTSSTPVFSYDTGSSIYCTAISAQGGIVVDGTVNRRVHLFQLWQEEDLLGTPSYSGGHWQIDFETSLATTMGEYRFRVRYADAEGGVSEWVDADDTIKVENNPPTAFVDEFPESPAFTTQTVNFSGHGTDVEGDITAYQWNSDIDGGLSDQPAFNLTDMTAGDHTITFQVQDEDGDWSAIIQLELEVIENQPPNATSLNFSAKLVYRGQTLYLYANATDDYSTEDNLTPEFAYRPPGTDPVASIFEAESNITTVGLNGDGQVFGVGTEDGMVYMFIDGEMTPVWSYDAGDTVNSLRVAHDATQLTVGTRSGYLHFMSYDSSTPVWSYNAGGNVNSTAISGDAMAALAGTSTGAISFFNTQSSTPEWTYNAGGPINQVALSPDGGIAVAGSFDQNLYVFFTVDSNPIMTFDAGANVMSVAMSMDLVVSGTDDDMAYAHFPDNAEPMWTRDMGSRVNSITISSDSLYILVGTEAGRVYLLNQSEWDGSYQLKWLRNTGQSITHVSLSDDGTYCLAGAADGSLFYFHKNSSTPLWTQQAGERINEVALSAQGIYQVAGADDRKAYFFDRWTTTYLGGSTFVDDHWVGTFAPPVEALPGNYSFRVRFHDPGASVSSWYYGEDTVEVQEGPPVAYIDSISPDPPYDFQEVNFTGHGEDAEDAIVAYQWSSDLDGELSTAPEFDAYLSVGTHTITFRVQDEEGQWSFNVTHTLVVKLYQPPEALSVDPSAASLQRGQSMALHANGTDDEVAEPDLTVELAYRDLDSGGGAWNTSFLGSPFHAGDSWQALFTPDAQASAGNYSLRVRFSDGIQWSEWYYNNASFTVTNSQPTATIDSITPDPGYDNHPVDFVGQADDLEGPLAAHQWSSDLDGELSTELSFQITGLTVGTHNLTFRVQDQEGLWSANATYQLEVLLYEPPNATSLGLYPTSLPRGRDSTVYANATDDVEAEGDLTPEFQYRESGAGTDEWNTTYLTDLAYTAGRWQVTFTPALDAALGDYDLRVRFADELGWSQWLYRNGSLEVTNARPTAYIDEVEPNPVEPGEQANFTGHGTDLDGTIVEYLWNSDLDGNLSDQASFDTTSLTEANHTISFSVRDNDGAWSEPVTLELVVEEYIEPPTAFIDSISPNPAARDEQTTFEGHGTTPQGTITGYQWSSDLNGALSNLATFSTDSLQNGTHTISFRVKNSGGRWSGYVYQELLVDIRPTATIQSISPSPANESEMVTFTGLADDADGTIQEYRWGSNVSGPFGSTLSVNFDGLAVGNHTISFSVLDDHGLWSAADTRVLWIKEFTSSIRPEAYIDNIGPSPAVAGRQVNFYGDGYDEDGTVVAYEWTSDLDGPLSTDEDFSTTSLSVGQHNISFRVQDDTGDWSYPVFDQVTVLANQAPVAVIDSVSPNPAHPGQTVSFQATATDADGTIAIYQWTIGGENLSNVEDFTNASLPLGVHAISFRVQDDLGLWSDADTLSLEVVENQAPVAVIENITPSPAYRHQPVYLNGSATDADGTIAIYQWSSDIMGVLGDQARLVLTNLSPYPHQLSFKVQDDDGVWSTVQTRALSVVIPNAAPQATISTVLKKGTLGQELSFQGSGFDSDGTILTYRWESDLDGVFGSVASFTYAGLSLGNHTISFKVQDDDGVWSAPDTMELAIVAAQEPDPQDEERESEGFMGLSSSILMLVILALCLLLGGGFMALALRRRKDDGTSRRTADDGTSSTVLPGAVPGMDETDRILAAAGATGVLPPPKVDLMVDEAQRIGDVTPEGPSIDFTTPEEARGRGRPPAPDTAVPELPMTPVPDAPDAPDLAELLPARSEPGGDKLPDLPTPSQPQAPESAPSSSSRPRRDSFDEGPFREDEAPRRRARPSGPFGADADEVLAPFTTVGGEPPAQAEPKPGPRPRSRPDSGRKSDPVDRAARPPATPAVPAAPMPPAAPAASARPTAPSPPRAAEASAGPADPDRRPGPTATIECPSCQYRMKIPRLGRLQTIKCQGCGLEGDVEL